MTTLHTRRPIGYLTNELSCKILGPHGGEYEDNSWNVATGSLVESDRSFTCAYSLHHQDDKSGSTRLHGARCQNTVNFELRCNLYRSIPKHLVNMYLPPDLQTHAHL